VDPTAGMAAVLKRKITSPCRGSNPSEERWVQEIKKRKIGQKYIEKRDKERRKYTKKERKKERNEESL
jgi:hypothetical protein